MLLNSMYIFIPHKKRKALRRSIAEGASWTACCFSEKTNSICTCHKYTNNLLIAAKTTNPQDGFPEGRLSKIKKHIKNDRLLSPPEGHI